jgi:hypothetical protein
MSKQQMHIISTIKKGNEEGTYIHAEMSDYGGTEAGGSDIITCIGRTAPKLDLC